MCFYIHPNHPDVKIAEQDIVCYKLLFYSSDNTSIKSPYRHEIYFKRSSSTEYINKKVKKFTFNVGDASSIYKGLHTYSELLYARVRKNCDTIIIYKAIIPKGTEYYYNPDRKEYVSLKLRVYRKPINQ